MAKVLIVDDDIDFLTQMELQMKAHGYEVVTADNQKDAESFLESETPDLAIVDLMMENVDAGFTLSYKIKKKSPGTPVIMVTNVTSETGMMFGTGREKDPSWVKADVILPKPVRYEQIEKEIRRLVKD